MNKDAGLIVLLSELQTMSRPRDSLRVPGTITWALGTVDQLVMLNRDHMSLLPTREFRGEGELALVEGVAVAGTGVDR
jgi:hypothetical protein